MAWNAAGVNTVKLGCRVQVNTRCRALAASMGRGGDTALAVQHWRCILLRHHWMQR